MYYIIIFAVLVGVAFIPAKMAQNKGYSFTLFYILSLVFSFLITLIIAACLKDITPKENSFYCESPVLSKEALNSGRIDPDTQASYDKIKARYQSGDHEQL